MRITKRAYDLLDYHISGAPPEMGGILGSIDGKSITHVVVDMNSVISGRCCQYSPNVEYLNNCISSWLQDDIEFKGVFHTHFANVETLSLADENYICKIMKGMPEEIDYLFFPVFILPKRKLICYQAKREERKVNIVREDLEIIHA